MLKTKGIFLIIAVLLSMASAVPAKSQSYYFRHYQVESGLSNNTVFCCVQDKKGFIWLGTKDGLSRFNGYSFDVFRSTQDSLGLGDSYIRSLYIDENDSLYVGTRIGIYKYQPVTETFVRIVKTNSEVTDIKKDAEGRLWAISNKRLLLYEERLKTLRNYEIVGHPTSTSICIGPGRSIWVATTDGYIAKWQEGSHSFIAYDLFKNDAPGPFKWIEKAFAAKDGKILVGTANSGVKLFDPESGNYKNIITKNKENNGIYVRDFIQKSDGETWIATESGIYIYNNITGLTINLLQQYSDPYSLSDNAVYTLCLDKEGGIWAGTYSGGVNYFHPQYATFEKFFPNHGKASLSGNVVREICPDNQGNLWIGTEDAGLNKLDVKSNTISFYSNKDIAYPNIHGLLTVGNKLLIGTFEHGLDVMDLKSNKIIAHYPSGNRTDSLRSDFFVVLYRTKNGTIYAGTRLGLYIFDLDTRTFHLASPLLANCYIHCMLEDASGTLWIGTTGNGLYKYDQQKKKLEAVGSGFDSRQDAGTLWITTIFQDTEANIWVGTEGNGLFRFDPEKNIFSNYSIKYGFPGNTIYKILEDDKRTLWISTPKGLVNFSPATKSIVNIYTTANGLLSDQFNYNSGYKDSSGRMYFGSVKGMISFNPKDLTTSSFSPPVYITSIIADGVKISPAGQENRSLLYASKVSLNHRQSSFSIEFAALSYVSPEMTGYRYVMEGLDNKWSTIPTNQKVYFTNLPPGNYTFKVQAVNGKEDGNTAQIAIEILPVFWESMPAKALYVLIAVGVVFTLIRNYHTMMTEKNRRRVEHVEHEKEKEMYKVKMDFLTTVAHEIRTPLTLIKAPLEKITQQIDSLPNIRKHLLTMQRNTERMITLSEELLNFQKAEVNGFKLNFVAVDLVKLIKEIAANFEDAAAAKKINIETSFPVQPIHTNIDKEAVTKIISNLLNNAIKYADGHVIIEVSYGTDNVSIVFKNDGPLIPSDMREKIFEPFFRLATAKAQPGAGLGLALARSLAILHNGSLQLDSSSPLYNIFVLTLPVSDSVTRKA
ncbi:MAG: histidine kinase [Bacteroidetes bacterium]|nr:histidine kinase [Bacteroidota bacterium]